MKKAAKGGGKTPLKGKELHSIPSKCNGSIGNDRTLNLDVIGVVKGHKPSDSDKCLAYNTNCNCCGEMGTLVLCRGTNPRRG